MSVKTDYRVLLADDHPVVLEGIRSMLKSPFLVAATATSAEGALAQLQQSAFDILLADYSMNGMPAADFIRRALKIRSELRVVVLSVHDDASVVREVINAGASAFVNKQDTLEEVIDALSSVLEGRVYLSRSVAGALTQPAGPVLTPRETEILKLIVGEKSSREIAELLSISENTVETHRKNILRKTGAANMAGLVRYAFANRLA